MGINDFGIRLAAARKEQGLTQEQVAARLGVTPQAVSKWERGNGYPDMELLYFICEVLNCSSDYLLSRDASILCLTETKDKKAAEQLLQKVLAEPLTLEMGSGFTELLTKEYQELLPSIRELRESMAIKYGFLLPVLRIRDNEELARLEYRILSYDRVLYAASLNNISEHTFRAVCDQLEITVLENFTRIVNRQMIQTLVDNLSMHYPAAVKGIIPDKISLARLQAVLAALIRRKKPIRNLIKILEILEEEEKLTDEEQLSDRIIAKLEI